MAKYNEILTGRFARALQKFTSMKGTVPTPQLAGEIMPAFDLNSIRIEDRYLLGFDTFAQFQTAPAVAAVVPAVRLRNPAGSRVLALVFKIIASGPLSDQPGLQFGQIGTDLATAGRGVSIDLRGRANSTCIMSQQSVAGSALSNSIEVAFEGNNYTYAFILTEQQYFPLLPGAAVQVVGSIVNQQINVTYGWIERAMEESELT